MERLSDDELLSVLDRLASEHCELVARMTRHLAEVERRELHLALGYSSMFAYATKRLSLSEDEAYLRIKAARAASRDARILDGLKMGELSLSTVKAIAPHLETYPELVESARGLSKRETDRLVAETTGRGRDRVRTQPQCRALSGGRVEVTFVVSAETAALLEQAQDLTLHENPSRDGDATLARALELVITQKKKPRGSVPAASERAMPKPRRCSFVGQDGHLCGERGFAQIDHEVTRAEGGGDEPRNLRWLCKAHNDYEAKRRLGTQRVVRARCLSDTMRALVSMGYGKRDAEEAVRCAAKRAPAWTVDAVLRLALKRMRPPVVVASDLGLKTMLIS